MLEGIPDRPGLGMRADGLEGCRRCSLGTWSGGGGRGACG